MSSRSASHASNCSVKSPSPDHCSQIDIHRLPNRAQPRGATSSFAAARMPIITGRSGATRTCT